MPHWSGKGIETPRNIKSFFPWKLQKENKTNYAKGKNQNSAKFLKTHQLQDVHSSA